MRSLKVALLALALTACAGDPPAVVAQKNLITACNGVATALISLAGYRQTGKLNADTIQAVDQIRQVAEPICTGPMPVDVQGALTSVQAALLRLQTIQAATKGAAP